MHALHWHWQKMHPPTQTVPLPVHRSMRHPLSLPLSCCPLTAPLQRRPSP